MILPRNMYDVYISEERELTVTSRILLLEKQQEDFIENWMRSLGPEMKCSRTGKGSFTVNKR